MNRGIGETYWLLQLFLLGLTACGPTLGESTAARLKTPTASLSADFSLHVEAPLRVDLNKIVRLSIQTNKDSWFIVCDQEADLPVYPNVKQDQMMNAVQELGLGIPGAAKRRIAYYHVYAFRKATDYEAIMHAFREEDFRCTELMLGGELFFPPTEFMYRRVAVSQEPLYLWLCVDARGFF